jgi:hypothetical protein
MPEAQERTALSLHSMQRKRRSFVRRPARRVGTEDQGRETHLARDREVDCAPVISRVAGERFS